MLSSDVNKIIRHMTANFLMGVRNTFLTENGQVCRGGGFPPGCPQFPNLPASDSRLRQSLTTMLIKPIKNFESFIKGQTKNEFAPLESLLVPNLRGTAFLKTKP